jgi:hypothetical protein
MKRKEDANFQFKRFSKNIRFLSVSLNFPGDYIWVNLFKQDNCVQRVKHDKNVRKIGVDFPEYFRRTKRLILKNLSGYLVLHYNGDVDYIKSEKVIQSGYFLPKFIDNFKQNVKDFQSEDYQHYAEEVRFHFLE